MRKVIRKNNMHKIELASCEVCGKEYYRYKSPIKSPRKCRTGSARDSKTVTCSRKCSRDRPEFLRKRAMLIAKTEERE